MSTAKLSLPLDTTVSIVDNAVRPSTSSPATSPPLTSTRCRHLLIFGYNTFQFCFSIAMFSLLLRLMSVLPKNVPNNNPLSDAMVQMLSVEGWILVVYLVWGPCYFLLGNTKNLCSPFRTPYLTYQYLQQARRSTARTPDTITNLVTDQGREESFFDGHRSQRHQECGDNQLEPDNLSRAMKSFGNAAALEDGKAAAIAMTTDVELSPTLQFDYRFVVFEVVLAVIVHLATLTLFARWTIVNFRAIRQAASMTNQIVANNTSLYSNVPAQTVSSIWSCVQVQSLPMEIQDVLTNVTLWNKAENGCTLHRTTIGLGIFDLSVIIAECLINLLCLSILILVSPRRMAARKAKGVSQGPSNEKDSSTIGRQEISSDNTDVKESADRQSEDLPHYYAGGTSVGPPSYKTSSYASSTSSTPSVLS